jgi:hypothetical protein
MSNLVFSDKLSLGDAIAAAGKSRSLDAILCTLKSFLNVLF